MSREPDDSGADWPPVSVIMPVRNEERHLRAAVGQVLTQDYPGAVELVVAVGPSEDRTEEIAREIDAADDRVRVIANPAGITPSGLNVAIKEAAYDVIVRVDGHGILSAGYLRRAVEVLRATGADNVGGVMAAEGETPFERAAARAYTSPLGLGGGRFHVGGEPGPVDSVYLGVFRRETLEKLGGFDETFVRAQDWELNFRIRAGGGTVWFTPELQVTYRPRPDLRALARQFYLTGRWRRVIGRLHPGTFNIRYLAAPTAVVGCAVGIVAGLLGLLAGIPLLVAALVMPAGYLLCVLAGSVLAGRGLDSRAKLWLPVVVTTMHMSWGLGFLLSPRSLAPRGSGAARTP
ncbi:glycosyltransferase family 2 protein [Actinopolymorpha sp. B9G3]|uniref:glycosyltransferase family 2 protein n=1 Tax=Actinopolymorpha sp. B9G3 TaxID=3158970 RepID=UPI0032D99DD1